MLRLYHIDALAFQPAGAKMRQSLGTAVFSGMIGVALFGMFLTPVFFFVLKWISRHRQASTALVPLPAASPRDAGGTLRGPAEAAPPGRESLRRAEFRKSENIQPPTVRADPDGAK